MTINLPLQAPSAAGLIWQVTRNEQAKTPAERDAILADPGFGNHFTDHMVDVCWSDEGRLAPPARLALRPDRARPGGRGTALRAGDLRGHEGLPSRRRVGLDVPARTRTRPACSARPRGSPCPNCPSEIFIESLKQLIAVDADWVPSAPETSLYLRPFMFAKEAFLGVRPAKKVAYYVIASPAGAYFHGGVQPVSIWLSTKYARAGKGGTGAAKTGGNYASSLLPQAEAAEHGCQQVLFLDEGTYLEELGGMNVVLVTRTARS